MLMFLAQRIKDGVNNQKNLFDSVVGQMKTYEKRWVVDVDSKSNEAKEFQINIINSCEPVGNKILSIIPTKNGIHLITSPFNVKQYQDKILNLFLTGENFFQAEIQKKNPTLIFYPNSLENYEY